MLCYGVADQFAWYSRVTPSRRDSSSESRCAARGGCRRLILAVGGSETRWLYYRSVGPIGVPDMWRVSCGLVPAARVADPEDCMVSLALLWHQHQPLYKRLNHPTARGSYCQPWVRLHAVRDYYAMAALVAAQPAVHLAAPHATSGCSGRENWRPTRRLFVAPGSGVWFTPGQIGHSGVVRRHEGMILADTPMRNACPTPATALTPGA